MCGRATARARRCHSAASLPLIAEAPSVQIPTHLVQSGLFCSMESPSESNAASPVVLISKEQQNEWKIIMCFANVKVSDMDWWIDPVGMNKRMLVKTLHVISHRFYPMLCFPRASGGNHIWYSWELNCSSSVVAALMQPHYNDTPPPCLTVGNSIFPLESARLSVVWGEGGQNSRFCGSWWPAKPLRASPHQQVLVAPDPLKARVELG